MSDFKSKVITLSFGCGFVYKQEDQEKLSDYWEEEDWNNLSQLEKNRWLNDFWLDWKMNYETGGAWIEGEDDE